MLSMKMSLNFRLIHSETHSLKRRLAIRVNAQHIKKTNNTVDSTMRRVCKCGHRDGTLLTFYFISLESPVQLQEEVEFCDCF